MACFDKKEDAEVYLKIYRQKLQARKDHKNNNNNNSKCSKTEIQIKIFELENIPSITEQQLTFFKRRTWQKSNNNNNKKKKKKKKS